MTMNSLIPFILFIFTCCSFVAAAIQNAKLYRVFIAKHRVEAEKLIPFAFSPIRHPEKLLFFFRKSSLPLLRQDAEVWKQRQRLKLLLIISLILPICGFMSLLIYAFIYGK